MGGTKRRIRRPAWLLALVGALAASAAIATSASAAILSHGVYDGVTDYWYRAEADEVNNLTVRHTVDGVMFKDPGAIIQPPPDTGGCSTEGCSYPGGSLRYCTYAGHQASCEPRPNFILVSLGVGADVLTVLGKAVFLPSAGPPGYEGGAGPDRLYGGAGPEDLSGGLGRDLLHGGRGDDYLQDGSGVDRLFGDAGNDWLDARDGDADTLDCGAGDDVAVVDALDTTVNCETVQVG